MSKKETVFRPFSENTFRFKCHKDISCFTECCAKLRLILTPYDILRMKNRLQLPSRDFLDRYTDTIVEDYSKFPMIKLKMNENKTRSCPFVTQDGCTIYEDRPGACRIYPLGRAATKPDRQTETREHFFLVNEEHCHGFEENREWTIDEWMTSEGVHEYNAMNDQWLEIVTSPRGLGSAHEATRKTQVFFTASYDLDRFRALVFGGRFLRLFQVSPEVKEQMAEDDVGLMLFAFDWLKFSLFGENTIRIST